MKILAFSDLHHNRARADALVVASAEADLVIGAGDFANHRESVPEALNLLAGLKAPFICVPGNNESEAELRAAAHAGWTVLHCESAEMQGLTLFGIGGGIPETPWDWSFDLSEAAAREVLDAYIGADILISHSPPKGIADQARPGLSLGSEAVYDAVDRLQPKLVLCGHIHESWGREGMIGQSRVVNLGPAANWFEL